MSQAASRSLQAIVRNRQFDPAYYIHGEDEYQKEAAVRQLADAAIDVAGRPFNFEVRRASELDSESLDVLLSTMPMFSERRVVVLQDPAALKKQTRFVLDRYLEAPAPGTSLIMVAASGKSDRALMERSTELKFDPLTPARVLKFIAHHAREKLNASITPAAAELLHSVVGSDLHELTTELDKLASYASGGEIDETIVADVIGVRHGETLGDLMDAIADRDPGRALAMLPRILAQPKTTGVSIVMALANQTLAMAWGRAKLDKGMSVTSLEREYVGLLKSAGWLMLPKSFDGAARVWARATDDWSADALRRSLEALLAADMALKETGVASNEQILAGLVLSMCASGTSRLAA
ncbi:MAG: DNA polymerase III subunit delta [Gemmatimonadaceae bacterium]